MSNDRWIYKTNRWLRLRAVKLAEDPLCYACGLRGRVVPASAVDHIRPMRAGGDPFPPLEGLMSLCHSCHSEKTQAVDRPDRWGSGRRFGGIDVDGNPVDPLDCWHGGGEGSKLASEGPGPMGKVGADLFSWGQNQKTDEKSWA